MAEHSPELIPLLAWALAAGGGIFLAVLKWIVDRAVNKLDQIEKAIDRTNATLAGIEKDMRQDLSGLDRRVSKIEAKCGVNHHSQD